MARWFRHMFRTLRGNDSFRDLKQSLEDMKNEIRGDLFDVKEMIKLGVELQDMQKEIQEFQEDQVEMKKEVFNLDTRLCELQNSVYFKQNLELAMKELAQQMKEEKLKATMRHRNDDVQKMACGPKGKRDNGVDVSAFRSDDDVSTC